MAQPMNRDELRRLSADIRRVYQALVRMRFLSEECEQVRRMADDLLYQSGLRYLTEGQAVGGNDAAPGAHHDAATELASSYVQIQRGFVALHDALYRLAESLAGAGRWAEAQPSLKALHQLEPGYADVAELYERSIPLGKAQSALEAGRWEDARRSLQDWLAAHSHDRSARDLLCETHYRPAVAALE